MQKAELRTVTVTRYITPLREGGSLPALTEADDDFKYVLKFKGAGHGVKALIAELLGSEIARALGFKVPELVYAQDLLQASQGLNLALHFLSGAINFDPVVTEVDEFEASKIVWLDAFITNVDRTYRNTNMLIWHKELWLIDHGASFYFHHSWTNVQEKAKTPFSFIKDHVLLPRANKLQEADEYCRKLITPEKIKEIVSLLPSEWLQWEDTDETEEEIKNVYTQFLTTRLAHSEIFIKEAENARKALI